jgi:dTDP-4-amino-4,6-dideoxygalactose transaminase
MNVTDAAADQLLRLTLWVGMTPADVARVAQGVAVGL